MSRVGRGMGALALGLLAAPSMASAFCGFYVSGAGGQLVNNATTVVLMREGTRTALSMQNNYQGPPQNFAMVVPVPVVLHEENVKTLPRDVFGRLDALAAPKLVEYWEQNPCPPPQPPMPPPEPMMMGEVDDMGGVEESNAPGRGLGVRVLARFEVGEYEIVILGARDSSGLETWLHREHYNIPAGASTALAPYVQQGMKFFVARVNVARVTFQNGQAMLSPLRFHYDSEQFSLPVRLGLLNSSGTQDLIVHILARGQRYDVANYRNVFVPTNFNVRDNVRTSFPAFYAALFDKTMEQNPGAVVTEYAWEGAIPEFSEAASTCDPCPPEPPRPAEDLLTLGHDVMPSYDPNFVPGYHGVGIGRPYVLTRLHYRYGPDGLRDDLVFRAAPAMVGGREQYYGASNYLGRQSRNERGAQPATPAGTNQFQARYSIRHWWPRAFHCASPLRDVWGGPPNGAMPAVGAVTNAAFAPRGGVRLEDYVHDPIPELHVTPTPRARPAPHKSIAPKTHASALPAALAIAPLLVLVWRRRRT